MVFNCCVNGCNNYNKDAQMHIFPKDRALYDIWINQIGREDLMAKPMDRVRKSYRICTIHFGPEARYVGSRYKSTLKCDAIPSLFPNTACRREASAKVYKSPTENSRTEQRESRETEQVSIVMPSTSQSICEEILPLRSTSTPERKIETEYVMCTPTKVSTMEDKNEDEHVWQSCGFVEVDVELQIEDENNERGASADCQIYKENTPSLKRKSAQSNIATPICKRGPVGVKQTTLQYLTNKNENAFETKSRELAIQERKLVLQEKKFEQDRYERTKRLEMEERRLEMEEKRMTMQLETLKNQQTLINLVLSKMSTDVNH
ncbi:uncharacterized protein [Diabrotica undecimpunctata]|uniref:uncharacterized protein isoform X2 n=1 Tax=Diabrotica undecimpunctata TaxID=50387 RepID=UPI003B632A3C